jgi:hypothetical protein
MVVRVDDAREEDTMTKEEVIKEEREEGIMIKEGEIIVEMVTETMGIIVTESHTSMTTIVKHIIPIIITIRSKPLPITLMRAILTK